MEVYTGYDLNDIEELIEESGPDCIYEFEEGTLIDNILFYSTRFNAYVAAVEYALNEWTSGYRVYIGTMDEVYRMWEKLVPVPA